MSGIGKRIDDDAVSKAQFAFESANVGIGVQSKTSTDSWSSNLDIQLDPSVVLDGVGDLEGTPRENNFSVGGSSETASVVNVRNVDGGIPNLNNAPTAGEVGVVSTAAWSRVPSKADFIATALDRDPNVDTTFLGGLYDGIVDEFKGMGDLPQFLWDVAVKPQVRQDLQDASYILYEKLQTPEGRRELALVLGEGVLGGLATAIKEFDQRPWYWSGYATGSLAAGAVTGKAIKALGKLLDAFKGLAGLGRAARRKTARVNRQWRNPLNRPSMAQIDNLRDRYNLPRHAGAIATGRTNIPGLENKPIDGFYRRVRDDFDLGKSVDGPIKAPDDMNKATRFSGHAEEDFANNLLKQIKDEGLDPATIEGDVTLVVSSKVCGMCMAGAGRNSSATRKGVLVQLSEHLPNVRIEIYEPSGQQIGKRATLLGGKRN